MKASQLLKLLSGATVPASATTTVLLTNKNKVLNRQSEIDISFLPRPKANEKELVPHSEGTGGTGLAAGKGSPMPNGGSQSDKSSGVADSPTENTDTSKKTESPEQKEDGGDGGKSQGSEPSQETEKNPESSPPKEEKSPPETKETESETKQEKPEDNSSPSTDSSPNKGESIDPCEKLNELFVTVGNLSNEGTIFSNIPSLHNNIGTIKKCIEEK
ncbi:hypothetical protein MHSWG343_06860 [Candidatus Mycoplasma haematohominis]|uniref:Uncharacterized protein n=1 Tax=Candidatus Mycoplasma haematohominis TaxID=1494318 RepID=A0A478FTL8_9MOLU|nr:hypothetical protein MHSWG343_06860 [Candidatus Mycoplasma haemohominis]